MRNKQKIQEMTSTSGSGSYFNPLETGIRIWKKHTLSPFEIPVSNYDDPTLNYDSLDGKLDVSKKTASKMERAAKKNAVNNKLHPTQNDESVNKRRILEMESDRREKLKDLVKPGEWVDVKDVISILRSDDLMETSSASTAGEYSGPIEIGLKKWKKEELGPYFDNSKHDSNKHSIKKSLKNNIKRVVGVWEKKDGKFNIDTHDAHTMNEDLAVWFGKKKKKKGSSEPQGPWVNICRKDKDGGHPPCGRDEAKDKGYPKCRAKSVAAKMTDSQKKSACAQKRKAEKTHSKSGTGNEPKMVSYKPKKESLDRMINTILEGLRK
jgi:hypothetical protein